MTHSAGDLTKRPVANITVAAQTLTIADSGKIFRVNVADAVFTLPAVSADMAGCRYTFVVDTVSATTGCKITAAANDNFNGGTDNTSLTNTAATDARGDLIDLICDGSEGWMILGRIGTWAEA